MSYRATVLTLVFKEPASLGSLDIDLQCSELILVLRIMFLPEQDISLMQEAGG